jgi:hypothetical protein
MFHSIYLQMDSSSTATTYNSSAAAAHPVIIIQVSAATGNWLAFDFLAHFDTHILYLPF